MKKVHSFVEMGRVMGVHKTEDDKPKTKRCRKCGGVMSNIPGTNVFLCSGKTEDGPCKNRVFATPRM